MNTRFRLFFIMLGALLVAATYTFPLWQPLLTQADTQSTGDIFPGLAPALQPTFQALPVVEQNAYRTLAEQNPSSALAMVSAALSLPTEVPPEAQALPDMSGPVVVATGEFTRVDPVRWAQGTLTIYEQADESKILRFDSFGAINGPSLKVILSASAAPQTAADVRMSNIDIDLGALQGTVGSQNYDIPAAIDLDDYGSVVIFSETLGLVYSYAPLQPA